MPERTPVDLLKTPVEPRPRSPLATVLSVAIAILALVCSTAVLCITTENQCNDRRDRRILQQPNVWLDSVRDEGTIYLVNSGPGAAIIKEYSEIYKGHPLPHPTVGQNYQEYRNFRAFDGEGEWAFGISALWRLREAASLCAGGKVEGCLRVAFDLNLPLANYMISSGQRLPILRITNLDEIRKRVNEDDFREWKNAFDAAATVDDIDYRIEYCPLSREFGPCRTITRKSITPFPELPACKSGLAALLP